MNFLLFWFLILNFFSIVKLSILIKIDWIHSLRIAPVLQILFVIIDLTYFQFQANAEMLKFWEMNADKHVYKVIGPLRYKPYIEYKHEHDDWSLKKLVLWTYFGPFAKGRAQLVVIFRKKNKTSK